MPRINKRRNTEMDKAIGTRLRQIRNLRGLTQQELGKIMGISFQQVQKYENGTNAIASTRINDLCRALDIQPDDLYDVDNVSRAFSELSHWAVRTALKLDKLSSEQRKVITALVDSYTVNE